MKVYKAKVWCEVTCLQCGAAVENCNFYANSNSIQGLKKAAAGWVWTEEYGNLCPDCQKKVGISAKEGENND